MTTLRAKPKCYEVAMEIEEISDSQNSRYLFSGISNSILTEIVKGKIDANELAKKELDYRGINEDGAFVGWKKYRSKI